MGNSLGVFGNYNSLTSMTTCTQVSEGRAGVFEEVSPQDDKSPSRCLPWEISVSQRQLPEGLTSFWA